MKIKRVYLEITNACNLDCSFCSYPKGNSFMSLSNIKDSLTQIKEISDYVYLHVLGEPLLHKDINKILSITDNLDLNVQLVTNGTLLYKHLDIFDHKSLRKLSISLHSMNTDDVNNKYFNTIEKVIALNTSTYIELRFYDLNNLNKELLDFKSKLVNKYSISATNKNSSYKLKDNVYIYYSNLFKWPNLKDDIINSKGICHGGIDQIAILNDGTVTLCCLDPQGFNSIGNIKESKLKDILTSDLYLKIINNLKNRKITNELCKRCSYRLRFDDKHN